MGMFGRIAKGVLTSGISENKTGHDFFFGKKAEEYDPKSEGAIAARSIGDPNRNFDIRSSTANAQTAQGAQGASELDVNNFNSVRGQQQGLADNLASAASGQGPSAAGMAANAQRDSNLAQAAALQSGRRGQSAGAGIRAAGNQVTAGNQLASQNEAIGRANEMNTARGQQAGVLGTMAGQDIGIAGQNASLGMQNAQMRQQNNQFNAQAGQQNSQFNANLNQNAAMANQQAQLGIGNAELAQRARQEGLVYSNLKPEQPGFFSPANVGTFAAAAMSDKRSKTGTQRLDGSKGKAFSPGIAKFGIQPYDGAQVSNFAIPTMGADGNPRYDDPAPTSSGPNVSSTTQAVGVGDPTKSNPAASLATPQQAPVQSQASSGKPSMDLPGMNSAASQIPAGSTGGGTLGPNQRVDPKFGSNSAAAYGNVLGSVIANTMLQKRMEAEEMAKEGAESGMSQASSMGGSGGGGGGMAGMAGGVMSNPAIMGMMSDVRSKSDIRPLDRGRLPSVSREEAREMFDEAPPYTYFYRPEAVAAGAPRGQQASVMWDDLQRTEVGRRMNGGKEPQTGYETVDYLKGLPAAFASLSDLNARIRKIESSKGGR